MPSCITIPFQVQINQHRPWLNRLLLLYAARPEFFLSDLGAFEEKRRGEFSSGQTCVEGAVSSTRVLGDVEGFPGKPSAWTVWEKERGYEYLEGQGYSFDQNSSSTEPTATSCWVFFHNLVYY